MFNNQKLEWLLLKFYETRRLGLISDWRFIKTNKRSIINNKFVKKLENKFLLKY